MAGSRPYSELRAQLSKEAQALAEAESQLLGREMALTALRHAMRLSQAELGATLNVGGAAIAKLEQRADMYVSTLRRYVEDMGGELEILARFPSSTVRITNFSDVDSGA